jgi:hypothetical protein
VITLSLIIPPDDCSFGSLPGLTIPSLAHSFHVCTGIVLAFHTRLGYLFTQDEAVVE